MFTVQFDGAQDSPVYVPLRRSKSKYRHLDNFDSFRRTRQSRRPKNWVGALPKPNNLKRLRKKEKFTWYDWICDWRTSLHKMGFVCGTDLVSSSRSWPTNRGIRRRESICMVKGDTAVFLYGSIHALPKGQNVDLGPFSTVYHVVRGRRSDASNGVKRLENNTAVGILPDVNLKDRGEFLVEFDGSLFEFANGVWRETTDDAVLGLYRAYRANSTHHNSIRPYQKTGQNGLNASNRELSQILDFDDYTPKFEHIKDLK